MKKVNQIIAIIVMFSLICSNCVLMTYATDMTSEYGDVSEYFSEKAAFSNDKIIVVLDNTSSITFKSFDSEFKKIIECSSINDLTEFKTKKIKNHIDSCLNSAQSNNHSYTLNDIELEKYHKILCLNLETSSKEEVLDAIERINKLDGVLCAFPDFEISIESSISNTNTRQIETSPSDIFDLLSLNQAWNAVSDITPNTVRVAVIDSGIDKDHLALSGKIDESTSAYMIGYADEEYDEFDGYAGVPHIDNNGHGTHVAGIIAASLDSDMGMMGVCPSVELVSIKVLNDLGKGRFSDLVAAMAYVASLDGSANAIDIVNISIEAPDFFTQELNQSLLDTWINDYDGLVVCAAGNKNQNLDDIQIFPASIDGDNIITVGASTIDDTRWHDSDESGSNYNGPVDIFAPGVDIISCIANGSSGISCPGDNCTSTAHIANGYHALTGTSMATPFVTGVAALMLSAVPNLTAADIVSIFTDSENVDSGDSSAFEDICESGGRLNALKAVEAAFASCHHPDEDTYYNRTTSTHKLYCSICDKVLSTEAHDFAYTSIDTESHEVYCSKCNYYVTEEHDLYAASVYNDVYYIQCHKCLYSFSCNCDREYESDGALGHYVNCLEGCFSNLEPHTYEITGEYNSSGHEIECVYCNYSEYEDHDLYMYSEDAEDYVVKCHDCSYTFGCWESPEYYGNSDDGHWVDCSCGCYSFFEPHTPGSYTDIDEPSHEVVCADCGYSYYEEHSYGSCYSTTSANYHYYECVDCGYEYSESHILRRVATSSMSYHYVKCSKCTYTVTEAHTWVTTIAGYQCSKCAKLSAAIPEIMSLSDDELSSYLATLSDDERDAFIASLPEDQLERVTALLPPENDDELLTE